MSRKRIFSDLAKPDLFGVPNRFAQRFAATVGLVGIVLLVSILVSTLDIRAQGTQCGDARVSAYHQAQCNASGKLIPWYIDSSGPFDHIMSLQARWWLNAPNVNGWPTYVTTAELDRNYYAWNGAIPGSTVAMAIEAYLKYYAYTGDAAYLNMVRTMGDYIVQQDLTPATYTAYPKFPWPVGTTSNINPDGSGHPANAAGNIMPDKGAMIGIALLHLYEATAKTVYRDETIQIANVLANNALPGTATQSPWPFRAQANTGVLVEGPVMGNQVFALRLYDELIRLGLVGNGKFQTTRENVWNWLKNVAIADTTGDKWMHFFEDKAGTEYNPTQFDALEMARYLLEKKEALDRDWFAMAGSLINLVKRRWVVHSGDYTAIAEQQVDLTPYNSHTARYASILAKYYEAGGPAEFKDEAYSSFAYSTYSVGSDGFADTYFNYGVAWTTDSFGDWMQHFMDGIAAIPEWAPGNSDHLLRSSSVVQSVTLGSNTLSYSAFDASGQEKLKLSFTPTNVSVNGASIATWSWDSANHVLVVNRANGTAVVIRGTGQGPDFSLSATPASQTVAQGNSTTYTASVGALNGFSGAVGFTVSGLPGGATATFIPASVTGSGSSTLNVTTHQTTPAGSYSLTILGFSGSVTRSASVTLTVTNGLTTVTFDDLPSPNRMLTGQYPTGVIDWGSEMSWYLSGPWGLFKTQSISVNGDQRSSASFTFLSTNFGLASLKAFNGGSGTATVTISCSGQTNVQTTVAAGQIATINTAWTNPCSTVTMATTNGWYTNFDDLVIFALPSTGSNFTLSATPGSRTVVQGNATSYTITVGALNGFSGTVDLSVSGLPGGTLAMFTPTQVQGSGASTLDVKTSSTTPAGSYTLTITGTSGSLTQSTKEGLIVDSQPTLNFPRALTPADLASTGFAVVNPNPTSAPVIFTLYSPVGTVVAAAARTIPAGGQLALLGTELFPAANQAGWVQLTSARSGLQGLWMGGDFATFTDGADAAGTEADMIFPLVTQKTELNIVNTASSLNSVTARLFGADGTELAAATGSIMPNGVLQSQVADFFPTANLDNARCIRVTGSPGLAGTAVINGFLVNEWGVTNAANVASAGTEANFPQVVSGDGGGGSYTTVIGVTNLSSSSQNVTITFTSDFGNTATVQRTIAANGSLRDTAQNLFNLSANFQSGWVRVTGSAPLTAFVAYADRVAGGLTVVPAQTTARTTLLFAHFADLSPWLTGLALLNTTSSNATVSVYAMTPSGTLVGGADNVPRARFTINAGAKTANLLSELIPQTQLRTSDGGFVFIQSTQPLYGIELFFTRNLHILANVIAGTITSGITFTPPNAP